MPEVKCFRHLFYGIVHKEKLRKEEIIMGPKYTPLLLEDESLHDLQLNGTWLIQKDHGFRFGMDAVLLSDFCSTGTKDQVADFGTGTGIISILMAAKSKANHIDAFEILPDMADMASRSVLMNGLEEKIKIWNDDCANAADHIGRNTMDAIVMNPPYYESGKTLLNPDPDRAIARHQQQDTLDCFLYSSYLCLKGKGKLFMIYPTSGMLNLFTALRKRHLEPKRLRMIHPFMDKPSNLFMVEAMKDAKPGMLTDPPLIVYKEQGVSTDEIARIYGQTRQND